MASVRAARIYQHPNSRIRALVDQARPKLRRAFADALRLPGKLFDRERAARMIAAGVVTGVANEAVDWNHWAGVMRKPVNMTADVWASAAHLGVGRINSTFRSGGKPVRFHKDIGDQFNWDRFNDGTVQRIREYQDALITELGTDARNNIQNAILMGLRAGNTPDQIAAEIEAVLGLTDRQSAAVSNFRRMVEQLDPAALQRQLAGPEDKAAIQAAIDAGEAPHEAAVNAMVQNYIDSYVDYRAKTIAQTEATRAASMGLIDSYQQAADRGVIPAAALTQQWQVSLDERTCPVCLSIVDMNPRGVKLGEAFDSIDGPIMWPPAHPSCRCELVMVTDLDLVPPQGD